MLNLKLTQDMLLVRRIEVVEPRTTWGLYLPPVEDSAQTPYRGLVLYAGTGRTPKLSAAGYDVTKALEAILGHYLSQMPHNLRDRARAALKAQSETPSRIPMQVKAGDTVIYSRNLLQEFIIEGETLAAMSQDSVLAVIEA